MKRSAVTGNRTVVVFGKLYGDFDVLNAHCLLNSSTVISKCASTVICFFVVVVFLLQKYLGHRKRPKIFYVNIILQ